MIVRSWHDLQARPALLIFRSVSIDEQLHGTTRQHSTSEESELGDFSFRKFGRDMIQLRNTMTPLTSLF